MNIATVRDAEIHGKVVLVRVDYNVPMSGGKVANDLRIRASLPTLEYLREQGARKIILISHLGRPNGKQEDSSLAPVAEVLNELVGGVKFVPATSGVAVRDAVSGMRDGEILLLENLRFFEGEEKNSAEYIGEIVKDTGAEIYVQDGFAVLHRAHASTVAVANFLPVFAGLLVEKEVQNLAKVMTDPVRPLLVIVGGSKVEDKRPLIEKFVGKADQIVIGGKIATEGYPVRDGVYVAEDFDENGAGDKLDIGPISTAKIAGMITDAGTIVWNGLLGKAEDPAYATSSTIVAEMMGEKEAAETIVCGGDTTGFVETLMEEHPNLDYSLISTGGGAALEFLLGNKMPGLEVIGRK